jgi:hypothetical protein
LLKPSIEWDIVFDLDGRADLLCLLRRHGMTAEAKAKLGGGSVS